MAIIHIIEDFLINQQETKKVYHEQIERTRVVSTIDLWQLVLMHERPFSEIEVKYYINYKIARYEKILGCILEHISEDIRQHSTHCASAINR